MRGACRFYSSGRGCRKGAGCEFRHDDARPPQGFVHTSADAPAQPGPPQGLVHTSALCFCFPEALASNQAVQSIRREHDKAYLRWMPHINFVYPFVPRREFPAYLAKLLAALQSSERFVLCFDHIGHFAQRNDTVTFNLQLDSASLAHCRSLHRGIVDECPELRGRRGQFVPHLTLGQCRKEDLAVRKRAIQEQLMLPIRVDLESLMLIARNGQEDPFEIVSELRLGR